MDIYTLIRNDHTKAKEVMHKILNLSDARHAERLELFYGLMENVVTHNEAEEETFYVALKQHSLTSGDAKHSEHEHHEAASEFDELDDETMGPREWHEKFGHLCDALIQHIAKEESRVFDEAKEVLTVDTAQNLAREMVALKLRKKPLVQHEHQERQAAHRG